MEVLKVPFQGVPAGSLANEGIPKRAASRLGLAASRKDPRPHASTPLLREGIGGYVPLYAYVHVYYIQLLFTLL